MEKYLDFINETAKSEKKGGYNEGDYLLFNSDWPHIKGMAGQVAQITEIKPVEDKRYSYGNKNEMVLTLKFIKPITEQVTVTRRNAYGYMENKMMWEETDTIYSTSKNLLGVELIPAEYIEGFKSGKLTKFRCSGVLESIFKAIKFTVKTKYTDASYFDCDREKDDQITYVPIGKIKEIKADPEDEFVAYKAKFRQGARVGRTLKKLNPDLTDPQVEAFVAEYKAAWSAKMEHINDRLRVVVGDDIQYWYLNTRYAPGGGPLNSSCMQGKDAQAGIAFYANNPNCIALCILLDDNDKLVARALIWRCSTPTNMIFMDRIYYVQTKHETMLKNFAKENGIVTKAGTSVVYGYTGKTRMEVKVKPWTGHWPYLDTFRYDHNKKIMYAG